MTPTSRKIVSFDMKQTEPPSPASTIVLIGRNSRGGWVARQQNGLYGGLFINRAEAVRYALFENGHHPESIVEAPHALELDIGGTRASSLATPTTAEPIHRRAA
jgi:hypothetical protein